MGRDASTWPKIDRSWTCPGIPISPFLEAEILKQCPLDALRRRELLNETVAKSHLMFDKLEADSRIGGRLSDQISLMRASRLFNFVFVATSHQMALIQEIRSYIPILDRTRADYALFLETSLAAYHTLAVKEYAALPIVDGEKQRQSPDQLWEFWERNSLEIEDWYQSAKSVAIIFTSSACAERVFALYTSLLDSSQAGAYEDRVEASVTLGFNRKQRSKLTFG